VAATRKVVKAVGMLDTNFYNYYEDVNWGWRGRLIDIKSYVIPKSVIYHKWGGSFSNALNARKLFFLERGRKASIIRNFSFGTVAVLAPSLLLIDLALDLYCAKKRMLAKKWAADMDVWKNLGTILEERRRIQSIRKARDRDVLMLVSEKIDHPYFDSAPAAKKMLDGLSSVCLRMLR
jgi:GT2 family glycosyltransferase